MFPILDSWGFIEKSSNTFVLNDFDNISGLFKINLLLIVDGDGSRLRPFMFTLKVFDNDESKAIPIKTTHHVSMIDFILRQMHYHEKVN